MKSNNSFSRITLPIVLGLCVLSSAAAVAQQTGSPPAQRQGQGRRNFDPAQARQNRLDGIRAGLDIKADDEWNAIKPLVEKVMDAQRDMGGGRMRGGGQGRRGGGNTTGADTQAGGQGGGQRRFGPAPLPEAEALQEAVDNNASKDEIQSKFVGTMLDRLFGGSYEKLLVHAIRSKEISAGELDRIRKLLDEAGQKGGRR